MKKFLKAHDNLSKEIAHAMKDDEYIYNKLKSFFNNDYINGALHTLYCVYEDIEFDERFFKAYKFILDLHDIDVEIIQEYHDTVLIFKIDHKRVKFGASHEDDGLAVSNELKKKRGEFLMNVLFPQLMGDLYLSMGDHTIGMKEDNE